MLKSEQSIGLEREVARMLRGEAIASSGASHGLKAIMALMPETCWIRMHGSFRYPVYPGWKEGNQIQEDMHLLYVRGGEGCYIMEDGEVLPLSRGSLVLISNDYPYRAKHRNENPLLISGLRFGLYKHGHCEAYRANEPFYVCDRVDDAARYDETTGKIHALVHGDEEDNLKKLAPLLVHQMICELYVSLLGKSLAAPKEAGEVQRAKRYIEAHAERKVQIPEVARLVGMSERYLQKRFKAEVGLSPKAYHLMVQMDHAYRLLAEGTRVAEAATMLGYSDAYAFSHQFKKHWGVAPMEVRKSDQSR